MNIIDIVFVAIVILCMVFGVKKGLLRSIVELAGFLLGVPAALALSKTLAPMLYSNFFHQRLVESTVTKIDGYGDVAAFVGSLKDTLNSLPFSLDALGQKFGIDINGTLSGMTAGLSNASIAEEYVNSFLKPIITIVCTGILFLVLFILIVILVKVVSFLLKNSHLPHGLREANGALGAVFGGLKGLVLVFVACTILGVAQIGLSLKEEPSKFAQTVESSFLVEKVNSFNPLFK